LIETLIDQSSLAPDKIKQVLPVEFSEHNNNRYFSLYKGESLGLGDQIEITMIDLRVRHTDETDGMVGLLGISRAPCITVDEVRTHYPDITPVPPRGHMLIDANFYSVRSALQIVLIHASPASCLIASKQAAPNQNNPNHHTGKMLALSYVKNAPLTEQDRQHWEAIKASVRLLDAAGAEHET